MDRWSVHPPVPEAIDLSKELRVHAEVLSILMRRGLRTASEISAFLNPSIQTLGRPESFPGVAQAAARIQKAIEHKEKILVYGDYDVDGVTATSILTPVLIGLGADAQAHLPHRIHEGYGLNIESLKEHLKRGVKLVITVDNGITSFDAVKFLKDSQADVIIVDHHLPKGQMPPADVIVSAASSPDTPGADLAACGLAFKLAWALAGDYAKVEHCLDLVTLGTIADLAPVEGENRVLLHLGMPRLAGTKRAGLRALMREAGIHPNYLSYRDIAFGLGPRINAAGRMGSPMDAYKLLTTSNETEAANLAKILEAGNRERQRVENDAYQEAVRLVEEIYPDKAKRHVLVVGHEEWHEGVLGIVAARLVDRFRRPAVAVSFRSDPGKGSGRSIPGFSIHGHIRHSEELLEAFGGHSQACGLSIRGSKFEAFRRKLNEASPDGALAEGEDTLWIDAEIPPARLDAAFLKDLQKLEPFGPGNPRPLFSSKSMRMRGEPKKRGKDTLQCWLTDAEGKLTCEAIMFRGYERWSKEMKSRRDFEIAYQPALKNTNGILSIELQIERWR